MELTFSIISLLFLGIMLRVFTILSPLVSQMFSKGGYYSSFILEENKNLGEKRSKITHSSLLPGPDFKSRSVIIWFPCFLHYSRPQWEWVRASLHTFPMLCSQDFYPVFQGPSSSSFYFQGGEWTVKLIRQII